MADSDNLELKKRSRRRLVGAAALALLAAIVLPMVMDDEPQVAVRDILVTIPDREADSLQARPIAGRPIAVDPDIAPAPQEHPDPGAPESPVVEEAVSPPVASVRPAEPEAPRAAEPSPRAPTQAPAPTDPGRPSSVSPDQEAARAQAILEGRAAPGAPARAEYVVQVGAFSDAGKAVSFSAELKAKGFSAYTEAAGNVTRVRIGPFRSRDDAQKAAEKLAASGIDGVVTAR